MPASPLPNATLIARLDHTPELATFTLRCEALGPQGLAFRPGQFVVLSLVDPARPALGAVRRSMSLASAPERADACAFYIRYVRAPASDNPLTHLLWRLQPGDRLHMSTKAVGRFTLEDTLGDDGRLRLLVAAGTGLAPFLSMVRSRVLRDPSADLSDHALLHGASRPAELGHRAELQAVAERHGLRYLPTVSRPAESPGWTGATGRVEDWFLPGRLEDLEARLGLPPGGLRPERAGVLVCGLQGTIGATVRRLLGRGFVPDHPHTRRALAIDPARPPSIWWEQYDTEPVLDLEDAALRDELRAAVRAGLAGPA
jgi:ferredoxin/flavodoxin---NADP+ reductase